MDASGIKMMFNYHYGIFDQIWNCVDPLSSEQFVEESDYSLGSVRNHLVHCMNVDDRWLARIQEIEPPEVLDEYTFPDRASVKAEWDATRERVLAYVNSLRDSSMEEFVPIVIQGRFTEPRLTLRRDILLHMVNHGTDHRAQILARLHELGAPTLEQDLILYLWAPE